MLKGLVMMYRRFLKVLKAYYHFLSFALQILFPVLLVLKYFLCMPRSGYRKLKFSTQNSLNEAMSYILCGV